VVGMADSGSDERLVHETGRQGQSSDLNHYIFPYLPRDGDF
jgi:hypothetical protein